MTGTAGPAKHSRLGRLTGAVVLLAPLLLVGSAAAPDGAGQAVAAPADAEPAPAGRIAFAGTEHRSLGRANDQDTTDPLFGDGPAHYDQDPSARGDVLVFTSLRDSAKPPRCTYGARTGRCSGSPSAGTRPGPNSPGRADRRLRLGGARTRRHGPARSVVGRRRRLESAAAHRHRRQRGVPDLVPGRHEDRVRLRRRHRPRMADLRTGRRGRPADPISDAGARRRHRAVLEPGHRPRRPEHRRVHPHHRSGPGRRRRHRTAGHRGPRHRPPLCWPAGTPSGAPGRPPGCPTGRTSSSSAPTTPAAATTSTTSTG